jgi:hypothetical protein
MQERNRAKRMRIMAIGRSRKLCPMAWHRNFWKQGVEISDAADYTTKCICESHSHRAQ